MLPAGYRRYGQPISTHPQTPAQKAARISLGVLMTAAGIAHLSVARQAFGAQVPPWVPVSADLVVVVSGVIEIALGVAMIALPRRRAVVGLALAVFFVVIFPGNIAQWVHRRDAFGLDSDGARLLRLFFQPVLIALALWSTGGWRILRRRN